MTDTNVHPRTIPPPPTTPPFPPAGPGATWAVVEIVGHVRHGGFVQLVDERNVRLWRIDIPVTSDGEPATRFYPPTQIHSIAPVSHARALMVAAEEAEDPANGRF